MDGFFGCELEKAKSPFVLVVGAGIEVRHLDHLLDNEVQGRHGCAVGVEVCPFRHFLDYLEDLRLFDLLDHAGKVLRRQELCWIFVSCN